MASSMANNEVFASLDVSGSKDVYRDFFLTCKTNQRLTMLHGMPCCKEQSTKVYMYRTDWTNINLLMPGYEKVTLHLPLENINVYGFTAGRRTFKFLSEVTGPRTSIPGAIQIPMHVKYGHVGDDNEAGVYMVRELSSLNRTSLCDAVKYLSTYQGQQEVADLKVLGSHLVVILQMIQEGMRSERIQNYLLDVYEQNGHFPPPAWMLATHEHWEDLSYLKIHLRYCELSGREVELHGDDRQSLKAMKECGFLGVDEDVDSDSIRRAGNSVCIVLQTARGKADLEVLAKMEQEELADVGMDLPKVWGR